MMQTSMTRTSFKEKFQLVKKWGYLCIVCGRPFANLACVTNEHIIPKSIIGNKNKHSNMAPSHWRCNASKGDQSLVDAAKLIDKKEKQLGKNFKKWLNARVPNRHVPWYALITIVDAEWFTL